MNSLTSNQCNDHVALIVRHMGWTGISYRNFPPSFTSKSSNDVFSQQSWIFCPLDADIDNCLSIFLYALSEAANNILRPKSRVCCGT